MMEKQTIVVKVGTSSLTLSDGTMDAQRRQLPAVLHSLCPQYSLSPPELPQSHPHYL